MGEQEKNGVIEDTVTQSQSKSQNTAQELPSVTHNGEASKMVQGDPKEGQTSDSVFQVTIKLPHEPYEIKIMVSIQEQVQDLRQSIMESPSTLQYSNFHLEHNNEHINDFLEISEVRGLTAGSVVKLVEDPYTEKEARMHLMRIREIIGATGEKEDLLHGVAAGLSLHDTICPWPGLEAKSAPSEAPASAGLPTSQNALAEYSFESPPNLQTLIAPMQELPLKTVKAIGVSAWNPPPPNLRQQGHLLYLQLTTNEGEQFQITSHVTGFFVNKSSNSKFDPFPRPPPKNVSAHSLFSLISILSFSFNKVFNSLLEINNKRDPLVNFQITNAIPSCPWLVPQSSTSLLHHQSDLTRTQEAYLMSGLEGNETMRDWNEEIQSTKELPRATMQDRVFRERLISKLFAEFTDAAARGAALIARGEVAPLNPTEAKDAQIFVYNNIFYSFGADGVGTFTSEGGHEAARVAVGKDVMGVKAVNQLDIVGLATAAAIIVDYLGKRIVAQSIVPGIFKQREPDEHQVDYGGVEGRDVVADNEAFVPTFSQVSKALKIKPHPVWDREKKRYFLEGSVETKGLIGTDGRKYILDLYRLTPLDISWLDEHYSNGADSDKFLEHGKYPHRMTVLRHELVESYWRLKMSTYVKEQVDKRRKAVENESNIQPSEGSADQTINGVNREGPSGLANGNTEREAQNSDALSESKAQHISQPYDDQEPLLISDFSLALNPDVFCGQIPQTEEEKEEWTKDEEQVRAVCDYLHQTVFPDMLKDLSEGEVGFPMDGQSLSRLLHKRGINVRYLGKLAMIAGEDARSNALKAMATQEMISRAFKHVTHQYLRNLPSIFATSCIAHLLNCLLGTGLNKTPKVTLDDELRSLYPDADFAYIRASPESITSEVKTQVQLRYRYTLGDSWIEDIKHIQLLRSVALKLGLQLVAKEYRFTGTSQPQHSQSILMTSGAERLPSANGHVQNNAGGKKKKRSGANGSSPATNGSHPFNLTSTFSADDIANMIPIVKDSSPKSTLAEEALEAGKISMMQNQKETGQELLLESLTLHEQIYGILHPEVARVYNQLAMLYFQLDEKAAAIELAHKAVIISERTLGIDSSETILSYLNLALFEHSNRSTTVGLSCVRHSLELWKIIYGPNHPDCMTTLNNAAVMLQQLQIYRDSRIWFEKSLLMSEEVSGKSSVNTATLLFQLAQALVLDGDHKGAVHRMREAYNIFLAKLGPEDANTKESERWLEQLTQNAVSIAKHAKDVQARRIRRVLFNPRATHLGARPQPQAGQAPANMVGGADSTSASGFDSRSIDELLKFIEGGGDMSRSASSKKRTARALIMQKLEHNAGTKTSPIRRSKQSSFTNSPGHLPQVPWTAGRCQRLLRPLSSRIALLRKLKSSEAYLLGTGPELAGQNKKPTAVSNTVGRPHQHVSDNQPTCMGKEGWDCSPRPRKRIKRTYSSRTKMQVAGVYEAERNIESNVAFSEGLSKRSLHCQLSMPSFESESRTPGKGVYREENSSTSLIEFSIQGRKVQRCARYHPKTAATLDPSRLKIQYLMQSQSKELYKLCDGIYTSLSTLLKATHSVRDRTKWGCQSLFTVCLKAVPDHIFEEDYWAKLDNPDAEPDMSFKIYSGLESAALCVGWEPLGVVVRAHGITIVQRAITNNLIPFNVIKVLVDLCIGHGAEEEAQKILESMTSLIVSKEGNETVEGITREQSSVLRNVHLFSEVTGKRSFLYQHLTALMKSELPWTSYASSLHTSLSGAVQSVTMGDEHAAEAATLIRQLVRRSYVRLSPTVSAQTQNIRIASRCRWRRAVLRSAASRDNGDTDKVHPRLVLCDPVDEPELDGKSASMNLANLLAVLSAVSIVQREKTGPDSRISPSLTATLVRELALEAHRSLELASHTATDPASQLNHKTLTLPLLADAFVTMMSEETCSEKYLAICQAFDSVPGILVGERLVNGAGSVICMIARFYGQATSSDAFDFMRIAIEKLAAEGKSRAWSKSQQSFLHRLLMAAAFAFAQETGQPAHLDWALNIEQFICARGDESPRCLINRTPVKNSIQPGNCYKWEEGICEWIAKTPAAGSCRPDNPSLADESTDDDTSQESVTPLTTPESDPALAASSSPCVKGNSMARIAEARPRQDYASLQCVKVLTGGPVTFTQHRPPDLKAFSQGTEVKHLETGGFQSLGVYDDVDELCAGPVTRVIPLSEIRHPRIACSGASSKGKIKRCKISKMEKQKLKRGFADMLYMNDNISDTEDELSFL
ncbi:MAG: hypothetical protein Q9163_005089 [Psora crenata]